MDVPGGVDDIDVLWLHHALQHAGVLGGARVVSADVTDISKGTGVFGDVLRARLTYDRPGTGAPDSVVVKLPTANPANIEVGLALRLYEREQHFYDHIAPTVPIRVPRRLYGSSDPERARYVLVLEDLTDLQVGDQVRGVTVHQAELAVDALAALHAAWWERPELHELAWLPTIDAPMYLATVPDIFRSGFPKLAEQWGDRLPAEALELGHRLHPVFEDVTLRCARPPHTFIHTDTRLDNLFFDPAGGDGFALIDWQLANRGRGVGDLVYLLGSSMDVPDQRTQVPRLLRRYHDALVANGVAGYPFDTCREHFLTYTLYYLCAPVSLVATFDTENERGAAMTDAFVERFFHLAVHTEAGALL